MPKLLRAVKENKIEAELVRRVEALGGICLKVTTLGRRGFFDRLIILPAGRIIFCEIKKPRGSRISPHQRQYAERLRLLGVENVCVIKTVDDIARLLRTEQK